MTEGQGLSMIVGHCPVPKCEHRPFFAKDAPALKEAIRKHLEANLQDPNHSDIADLEGWFDPDPLGD